MFLFIGRCEPAFSLDWTGSTGSCLLWCLDAVFLSFFSICIYKDVFKLFHLSVKFVLTVYTCQIICKSLYLEKVFFRTDEKISCLKKRNVCCSDMQVVHPVPVVKQEVAMWDCSNKHNEGYKFNLFCKFILLWMIHLKPVPLQSTPSSHSFLSAMATFHNPVNNWWIQNQVPSLHFFFFFFDSPLHSEIRHNVEENVFC